MASRLQDVIQRGVAASRPAATAVAHGTLYYSTDTQITERSNGTAWESYSPSVAAAVRRQITLVVDNGTSAITTGYKAWVSVSVAGTLKKWRILADVSGSIVVDVWKDVYANYPPTVADTITASAKPTLSSAISAENSTLTGWTTTFSAGDVFAFNVDSVSTVKKISLTLEYE